MIEIWTDGAAQPTNPGPAGAGAIGYRDGEVVFTVCAYLGEQTNNVAEYEAVIYALDYAPEDESEVHIYTDSRLVVEQFNRRWKCNNPRLRMLLSELQARAGWYDELTLEWIPREENEEADELSKLAATHGR